MRMEIRGRNVEMTDDLRELVSKGYNRLGRQVSGLATLDVVLYEERNPSISDRQVAEATVRLKGEPSTPARRRPTCPSRFELSEDVRRQVKKHRELMRKRKMTRRVMGQMRGRPAV